MRNTRLRRPFHLPPFDGENGDGGGAGGGANQQPPPEKPDRFKDPDTGEEYAFPPETPIANMSDEQRAEYWRHKARKHEKEANRRSDYDQLKADAEKYRAAQREQLPPDQKAIAEAVEQAKQEALAEARRTFGTQLVTARFEALLAGSRTPEQVAALVAPLDLTKFLTDTGDVNTGMVEAFAQSVAPTGNGGSNNRWPDIGQGNRGGSRREAKGVAAGRDLYAAHHKKETLNS